MTLPSINTNNTSFELDNRNLLITNDLTTGNILFTSDKHNISPKVLGTVVALEATDSTDSRPRIKICELNADGTEKRVLIKRKETWFFFKDEANNGNPVRTTTGTTRQTSITEVAGALNALFNEVPATTSVILEFGPSDTLNASRDATNTTVLFDNGKEHAVNAVKAIDTPDGFVSIVDHATNEVHMQGIRPENVTIAGNSVGTNQASVVNALNALFTVNPLGAGYVPTVVLPTLAGAPITPNYGEPLYPVTTDPITGLQHVLVSNGNDPHGSRVWSDETIDQSGEHFDFHLTGKGQFLLGFYDPASDDPTELAQNSGTQHTGAFWTLSLYNYGSYMGPHTIYGSNPGLSYGPGWNGAQDARLSSNQEVQDNHDNGASVLYRAGINASGYAYVSYFDAGRSNEFIMMTRRNVVQSASQDLGLLIKCVNGTATVATLPTVFKHDETAPTLTFHYIESPDGNYDYPLFLTAEEAEYYDQNHDGTTGTGTSHTHTYVDDASGTTWYMPDTGRIMNGTTPPQDAAHVNFQGQAVSYTTISTEDDANHVPSQFTGSNYTQEEGTNVNLQLAAQGVPYTTSVEISPAGSGLVFSAGYLLQGTLPDVGADTTYTVTVTRANAFGSSVGSFTITATDVAPPQTNDTAWTKALDFSGSNEHAQQVSSHNAVGALRMGGSGNPAANNSDPNKTSSSSGARPWATTVVFRIDGNNSNQHIWNQGEGSGSSDDNIYLRLTADKNLVFGWGKGSDVNECELVSNLMNNSWYGIYIAFKGGRFNTSGAQDYNLAAAFDIRFTGAHNNWALTGNLSSLNNWTSTNENMLGNVLGYFTVGGRGSNRSFHGKVASMVVTTLMKNTAIPTDDEILCMITDPVKWMDDYKVGNDYRYAVGTTIGTWQYHQTAAFYATQVWLMGDGTNDSYGNMIRNQAGPTDQNMTKLNLISMTANDIETVNINGLT